MNWLTIGVTVVGIVLALVRGIWGTDKPTVSTIVEITGLPVGPVIANRLSRMEDPK